MIRWEIDKSLWRWGLPKCHHTSTTAVLVLRDGRRAIREQCQDCGKLDTAPLKLADHPDAPPANDIAAAHWQAQRDTAGATAQAEAQRRFALRQSAKVEERADWFEDYGDYLASDDWQRRRAAVLARDGHRCQALLPGCTRTATEVHHTSYVLHKAIGAAPTWELQSCCHGCHQQITEAERAARKK